MTAAGELPHEKTMLKTTGAVRRIQGFIALFPQLEIC
jgi:hypothetical protein